MLKPPCKNCTKRELKCHSTCEDYIAYDEKRKAIQLERFKQKQLQDGLWEVTSNLRKRYGR